MKYFFDTEFIEGFHKPLFGKRRHFIDLVSIGIVTEDGREYYAISNEFNPDDADIWVQENVIHQLPDKMVGFNGSPRRKEESMLWKSNKQIAKEVEQFCKPNETKCINAGIDAIIGNIDPNIEFYAYYADYDWVVLCSLFGRMIDLPKGFPMYCIDLKQTLDEKAKTLNEGWSIPLSKVTLKQKIWHLKNNINYPKQENEHNALDDAKWNFQLFNYLQNV